jgi:hypothetical protein
MLRQCSLHKLARRGAHKYVYINFWFRAKSGTAIGIIFRSGSGFFKFFATAKKHCHQLEGSCPVLADSRNNRGIKKNFRHCPLKTGECCEPNANSLKQKVILMEDRELLDISAKAMWFFKHCTCHGPDVVAFMYTVLPTK